MSLVKIAHVKNREGRALFSFVYEAHSHHVDWKAYEVCSTSPEGVHTYGDFGHDSADIAAASPYASGHLKWDGCVNMSFDEQERGALHFCGPEEEPKLAVLMRGVYALGPAMESWDHGPNEG